jgi:Secretion system C-terminal sorting domain
MIRQLLFLLCILFLTVNGKAQNQNLSNGNVFEGEPFIAVNPSNSQHLVVAWMGFVPANGIRLSIKIKTSFDAGATWSAAYPIPHVVSTYQSADPSMAFDDNGNLFLSFVDYRKTPDSGGVYLFKSVDGGLNWSAPTLMIDGYADGSKLPVDRPWLAINRTGDKLFLTTKPAPWILPPNRAYFVTSTDSGQTWQPWRYIDTTNYLIGNFIAGPMAVPAVSGNQIHVVYPSYVIAQNVFPQFLHAASDNNGITFDYSVVQFGADAANNDTAKLGYQLLADPSDTNHLAFLYLQQPFGDIDVMLTESFDAGLTWSTAIRVNDDGQGNGKMQDMLWADFDSDGDLIVSWRDRRNAAGSGYTTASEYYAAFRDKDSANFSANFQISDSLIAYNTILEQSGNDFMGIVLATDTLSAVWGNTRDGSLDIWFVRMVASTGQVTSVSLFENESKDLIVFPNPSAGIFSIQSADHAPMKAITVISMNGELVSEIKPDSATAEIDLTDQPSGIYILSVETRNGIYTKRIVR